MLLIKKIPTVLRIFLINIRFPQSFVVYWESGRQLGGQRGWEENSN